jgi:hypothetical protein
MSGSAQLIAERHPDGRPRARLSMVESTLGSSGVQVPCLGHTGLITASYTDFDGYVNINNGNVYLVAEGDLNFGFGFSTHFVTEMGGTVDDDGSLTLSILASDLTQD